MSLEKNVSAWVALQMETVSLKMLEKKNHILRNEIKIVCAAKFLTDFSYIISCVVVVSKMYQVAKQTIIELRVTVSCYF